MKFEESVSAVCGENWRKLPDDERDGGFGVALMEAFLESTRPTLDDLAKFLEMDDEEKRLAEVPFRRLHAAGLFSMKFNARRDRALNGWTSKHEGRAAWCYVAGAASGWVGGGYFVKRAA